MMPFKESTFDVLVAKAVLEHIPDPGLTFSEISRLLEPSGIFVGYVAFMECFHEINYCHLSFKALEYYSEKNRMKLEKLSGGRSFGIVHHISVLLFPLPTKYLCPLFSCCIRGLICMKAYMAYLMLRLVRHYDKIHAAGWLSFTLR